MKFGLRYCNIGRYIDPSKAVELAQAGEEAGFESAWTIEHTVVPDGYQSHYPYSADGKMPGGTDDFPIPDPLIWMAYIAAATSRINLGTAILILPQHNPVITAKQVATLDHVSGGRILLGIGVGWMKEEFDAIGASFHDRGKRADEYVAAMRELWSSERPTFHGDFVHFDAAFCKPQPVNKSIPIIVGGDSRVAARRAGRLGDGYFPARGAPFDFIDLARRTAEEHGRDPDALEITTSVPDDLSDIPKLAAAGVKRLAVPVSSGTGLKAVIRGPEDALKWRNTIEKYADL
jgi:probable F420-dependent oxidoreductase